MTQKEFDQALRNNWPDQLDQLVLSKTDYPKTPSAYLSAFEKFVQAELLGRGDSNDYRVFSRLAKDSTAYTEFLAEARNWFMDHYSRLAQARTIRDKHKRQIAQLDLVRLTGLPRISRYKLDQLVSDLGAWLSVTYSVDPPTDQDQLVKFIAEDLANWLADISTARTWPELAETPKASRPAMLNSLFVYLLARAFGYDHTGKEVADRLPVFADFRSSAECHLVGGVDTPAPDFLLDRVLRLASAKEFATGDQAEAIQQAIDETAQTEKELIDPSPAVRVDLNGQPVDPIKDYNAGKLVICVYKSDGYDANRGGAVYWSATADCFPKHPAFKEEVAKE